MSEAAYLNDDVQVAEEAGERAQIVEDGPRGVVVVGLAAPDVAHGQAPQHVHDDERDGDEEELRGVRRTDLRWRPCAASCSGWSI